MSTYNVVFSQGDTQWAGYPYFASGYRLDLILRRRGDYILMTLHGRAAELMEQFKSLRDNEKGHAAGVLADCLEESPELAVCADPTIFPKLIACLRASFEAGTLVGGVE